MPRKPLIKPSQKPTTPSTPKGKFAPDLRPLLRPLTQLHPDPRNARQHSERNLKAIANSLRRFGQQTPIVVDAAGIVRKGNGTLAAAQQLGWSHLAALQTDLAGAKLQAYALADNRAGDADVGSTWHTANLAQILADLQELEAPDLDITDTGFDLADIDDVLLAQLENKHLPQQSALNPAPGSSPGTAGTSGGNPNAYDPAANLGGNFGILITCTDENHQKQLSLELEKRRLKHKLLVI